MKCAQVLLTLEDLSNRKRYVKARRTFEQLFELGAIPVVNENDTVAVEELKFGDNDSLSAQVAALVDAEYLFLLTDVDGLYTANPSSDRALELFQRQEQMVKSLQPFPEHLRHMLTSTRPFQVSKWDLL